MSNEELKQHEDEADELNRRELCGGSRLAAEERNELYRQCFSFEAIKNRMQVVNKAYAASHGILDEDKARINRVMEMKTV